jgi:hypothetical protein
MGTPGIHDAILQAGYTPFYEGVWCSDHRGHFVDISIPGLFTGSSPHYPQRLSRHVSSNNKKQVYRFVAAVNKHNSLPQILQNLHNLSSKEKWTDQDHALFETSDQTFTAALLKAKSVEASVL